MNVLTRVRVAGQVRGWYLMTLTSGLAGSSREVEPALSAWELTVSRVSRQDG